jgi:ABC-type multidrug transport system fused ATPase/permease subunit
MYKKLDERYGISLYAEGCQRWYNLRRGYSSQLFFCGILFYMVYYHKKYSAESIAIILQTTEDFINLLINSSMYLSQLEISMIGLERCTTLMKIDSEKNPDKDITSELQLKNWPNRGKIKIVDFSASYRPETPIILKNINIEIEPGEKIGIVGRTGSGKSSLVLSLARVIEPQTGNIFIDDENIQNINLEYLRDKLSIVAQDPFLIESNVKDNIDPLHLYEDDKILEILNDFCLFEKYGNEKLNINISENGKNLSLGQKQLISFARAVIKKNKIIILDEATSSVDTETEKIIQNNMEKYFGDSTVIIIAHHLQMVKNCKTIYVIDNGEIVESGSYSDLLKDKNSKFYSLYLKENNS